MALHCALFSEPTFHLCTRGLWHLSSKAWYKISISVVWLNLNLTEMDSILLSLQQHNLTAHMVIVSIFSHFLISFLVLTAMLKLDNWIHDTFRQVFQMRQCCLLCLLQCLQFQERTNGPRSNLKVLELYSQWLWRSGRELSSWNMKRNSHRNEVPQKSMKVCSHQLHFYALYSQLPSLVQPIWPKISIKNQMSRYKKWILIPCTLHSTSSWKRTHTFKIPN